MKKLFTISILSLMFLSACTSQPTEDVIADSADYNEFEDVFTDWYFMEETTFNDNAAVNDVWFTLEFSSGEVRGNFLAMLSADVGPIDVEPIEDDIEWSTYDSSEFLDLDDVLIPNIATVYMDDGTVTGTYDDSDLHSLVINLEWKGDRNDMGSATLTYNFENETFVWSSIIDNDDGLYTLPKEMILTREMDTDLYNSVFGEVE